MKQNERIYLDNAATTQVDEEVLKKMLPYFSGHYGNPSSIHYMGRETRIAIEDARKKIASLLNVKPKCIIFTSCGTESNNTAIRTALHDLGCNHIITSKIEHHAVLHTVEYYAKEYDVEISYVNLDEDGIIDKNDLRKLLETKTNEGKKCFVTLMHANNETGQFSEIRWISSLCKKHGAVYHSDCVQTIGHLPMNLSLDGVHMASASAHKFHGPKGIGFLYVHEDLHISPLIWGGGQERSYRAGTENVAFIIGMAEALQLAYQNFSNVQQHVLGLKQYLATFIKKYFPGAIINSNRFSLYSTLSVSFPKNEKTEMLLLQLDIKGICVSGGSACSGGKGSHVMEALGKTKHYETIRFSFSNHNTREELDKVVEALIEILQPEQTTVAVTEHK
jgi:cysteine desulfurase